MPCHVCIRGTTSLYPLLRGLVRGVHYSPHPAKNSHTAISSSLEASRGWCAGHNRHQRPCPNRFRSVHSLVLHPRSPASQLKFCAVCTIRCPSRSDNYISSSAQLLLSVRNWLADGPQYTCTTDRQYEPSSSCVRRSPTPCQHGQSERRVKPILESTWQMCVRPDSSRGVSPAHSAALCKHAKRANSPISSVSRLRASAQRSCSI